MLNTFLPKSLKSHIVISFSLIFIIVIGSIGIAGYKYFSSVLTEVILNYSTRIVDEARLNIDSYFGQIKTYMQIISSNKTIIDALKFNDPEDYRQKLYFEREIVGILLDTVKFNSNIKDFIVIGNDGTVLYTSGQSIQKSYDFYEQGWFPQYLHEYAKVSFVGVHPQGYYMDSQFNKGYVISAVIPVIDFMSSNKRTLGMVLCNINIERIQEINKENVLEKTGTLLIIDENSQIIHKPEYFNLDNDLRYMLIEKVRDKESGDLVLENESQKMVVVFSTSRVTNWKVTALIPEKEILLPFRSIKTISWLLIIMCIILTNIASVIISGKITKPIVKLVNNMSSIEKGNFDIKLHDDSCEEIKTLSSRIDLMVERINLLNRDIYLFEIKNRDANIKALQAQINPHFLFNSLQSIKAMVVCGKNKDTSRMVTLLGNILRYAIYDTQDLVNIKSEIDHVEQYIQIQNYRYPNVINYKINCSEELEKFKTLKLILQPIVENSIYHGLKDRENGIIEIEVVKTGMGIRIRVTDNGIGMDEEELKRISENLDDMEQKDDSSSIGLKNVHGRLRLRFGKPFGLEISSVKHAGTCVTVLIPSIEEDAAGKNGKLYLENNL